MHYFVTDAIGSVVAVVDEARSQVNAYSYSPRGVTRSAHTTEEVDQPYRFAGGYQDDTGLYHLSARYYDPRIGRFTQPDPSGQEENPYLYAEGDPVNRIDPTGLYSDEEFREDVGFVGSTTGIGAGLGAAVGSVVPVVGTGAGGGVGAAAGFGFGVGYTVTSRVLG
ncbi:RHS repeat-associated core domain-containing protein [Streptomyces bohaiensis]|uniref:RHS repeat-associated core domain-containing protein n=1 Tax=Streptomyces bohaiensis TaxID=1431344 RepID=UPI0035E44BB7